jgi:hypothetical protein
MAAVRIRFALLLIASCAPASAGPVLSTCTAVLAAGAEPCRARVATVLERDGYRQLSARQDSTIAASNTHSIAVTCIDAGDRIFASVVLAGASDASAECARLTLAIAGGDETAQGRYLEVHVRPDGKILVRWHRTPGDDSDWIAVQPADDPDTRYDLFWSYSGPDRAGRRELGPLRSGHYEARLYLDWPKGQYEVHERLRFYVPPH